MWHLYVRSANILLDEHFDARIGDFGLAREGPQQQQDRIFGTRPYLPENYLKRKELLSPEIDTYSFGVVNFSSIIRLSKIHWETKNDANLDEAINLTPTTSLPVPKPRWPISSSKRQKKTTKIYITFLSMYGRYLGLYKFPFLGPRCTFRDCGVLTTQ